MDSVGTRKKLVVLKRKYDILYIFVLLLKIYKQKYVKTFNIYIFT